jgi:hypothetical protein
MAPADVPGDFRVHFGSTHQGIDDVVVVLGRHVAGLECGRSSSEIYRDRVFGNWNRPEQSTLGDPRIEIVNLHVLHGTCEYIKSYEDEGTVVIAPIRSDELAAHEAHIGLEGKMFGRLAGDRMGAHSPDRGPAHKSIEIGDGGRFST